MPDETTTAPAPDPVVEPAWRDTIPTIPIDDEDTAYLESRIGANWREIMGMPASQDEIEVPPTPGDSDVPPATPEAVVQDAVPAALETPPVEAPPVLDDETRQLAEVGRQWKDAFARDPKGALAALLNSPAFSHDDKVSLFQQVTQTEAARQVAIDPTKYEPASEFEKALLPNLDWMRGGEQRVAEALAVRDKDIQHTYVEGQAIAAKLDAICEFIGLSLPAHDTNAIFAHYDSSTQGTLQEAVTKVYRDAALKAARAAKQAAAPRPTTVRNQAGSAAPVKPVRSIGDAYQRAGEMLGLVD